MMAARRYLRLPLWMCKACIRRMRRLSMTGLVKIPSHTPQSGQITVRPAPPAVATWQTLGIAMLVSVYIVGKMFYVGSSGDAQLADIMLVGLVPFLIPYAAAAHFVRTQYVLVAMFVWILLVNAVWAAVLNDTVFLMYSFYFGFNILVCAAAYAAIAMSTDIGRKWMIRGLQVSAVAQLAAIIILPTLGGRAIGTFNNPNQLAYWAVCAMMLLHVLRGGKLRREDIVVVGATATCVLLSYSFAGFASWFMMLFFSLWVTIGPGRQRLIITTVGVLLVALALTFTTVERGGRGQETSVLSNMQYFSELDERRARAQQVSQLQYRNIDRVSEYYSYTLVGAGEGGFSRFEKDENLALEIHSSFVTIFFSYGLVGIVLFLGMIVRMFMRSSAVMAVALLPAISYGLTHNGLRFSFMWLAIGLIMGASAMRTRAVNFEQTPAA